MRSAFRAWGYESEIFSERHRILPELRNDVRDIRQAGGVTGEDDIVLLHLSIGSVVNDLFRDLSCRKAILYHNITPPEYLRGVHEEVARRLEWGREQVRALAGSASCLMADSRYNAEELKDMGYGDARVLPLFLDFSMIRTKPDRSVLNALRDGKINVLFVGRCAPNKRIEDALSAFCCFQRTVERGSRFIHTGSFAGMERYHALLIAHAQGMELRDVLFTGAVSQRELSAYYAAADIFLCMSEHEGFCIPLVESMAHGVPVLAYAAAAVPETMAGAGVLFREKRYDLVAEMMGVLVGNRELRDAVILEQRRRIERYERRDLNAELKECLSPLFT